MRLEDCALRPVSDVDAEQMFAWRNSERVRLQMHSRHEISRDEHLAWFARRQGDATQAHFVFEHLGRACGLVYFTHLQPETRIAKWGFYLGDAPEGSGYGTAMGVLGLDRFFDDFPIACIEGEVRRSNERSRLLHLRLGFRIAENDGDPMTFFLPDGDWRERRGAVIRTLAERHES